MVNKLAPQCESIIDNQILNFIDTHIHIYRKLKFTPNILTTLSLIFGLLTAYLITKEWFKVASLMYLISYYFDCADGKFARRYNMVTLFGDYYDHVSDTIKAIIILIALYITNKPRFSKWFILIIILTVLTSYHMGLQQSIYNDAVGKKESPTLDILKPHINKKYMIKHTRIFGPGTFNVIFCLIIFFWKKNKS